MAYPNPTTGIITISEEFINNEYFIYSITGKLIKKGVLNTNIIDLSMLNDGIYLIKIRKYNSSNWITGKVVKINKL